MILSDIRALTRTLTNITVQDQINDTLLTSLVNESLYELHRVHGSGWGWAVAPLVNSGDAPTFDSQFHQILVYRTASRMLRFLSDDTARSEVYLQEYQTLLADMEKFYLSATANPNIVSGGLDIARLTTIVRNLTGLYDTQTLSNGMAKEIINVAYTEFANLRDWNYASLSVTVPIASIPWQESAPLALYPAHSYLFETNHYTATSGLRRVRSVSLIDPDGVTSTTAIFTDDLSEVSESDENVFYTIISDHEGLEQVMLIAPEQDADSTLRISYYIPGGRIDTLPGPPPATTVFEIPTQFQMLLPYRAAQFALMQIAPDDKRIDLYAAQYGTLLDAFISYDQLSHDNRSFSIGERGKDDPRYVPWFKPA